VEGLQDCLVLCAVLFLHEEEGILCVVSLTVCTAGDASVAGGWLLPVLSCVWTDWLYMLLTGDIIAPLQRNVC